MSEEEREHTFYTIYDIDENDMYEKTLKIIYFATTTVTTVGFGDLYPGSDMERIFTIFLLVSGLWMFGKFVRNFHSKIKQY